VKAPDESGINEDCTEKSTDWIATAGKRCTPDAAAVGAGQHAGGPETTPQHTQHNLVLKTVSLGHVSEKETARLVRFVAAGGVPVGQPATTTGTTQLKTPGINSIQHRNPK